MAEMVTLLAGTAAEEIILGDRGEGAGGTMNSDLRLATLTACRLQLLHGLGGRLASLVDSDDEALLRLMRSDASTRARIEEDLRRCMRTARKLAKAWWYDIEALASTLSGGKWSVADEPACKDFQGSRITSVFEV